MALSNGPSLTAVGGMLALPVWAKGLGRHCQTLSRVNCSHPAPTPEGVPAGALAWRAAQNQTGADPLVGSGRQAVVW